MNSQTWITIIISVLGTGGIGTLIALFVVPAPRKFESVEKRIATLEKDVKKLSRSNRFLMAGLSALTRHSDALRLIVLRHDPQAQIQTASEVLEQVRHDLAVLDGAEEDDEEQSE